MDKNLLKHNSIVPSQESLEADFRQLCRQAGSEGVVLLKNDGAALPLSPGTVVSVFGRIQTNYIKSGTGSGGLVNVKYVVGIPDGLRQAGLTVNQELADLYAAWEQDHPFDNGTGWASEPWSQEEMPLDDTVVRTASATSDAAVVVIGRSAGEDKDNQATEGSYLLSAAEEDMLLKVTTHFQKVIVVLNTGNILDMKWVETYQPTAVLYAWQGGQEGGGALGDILAGHVCPSGKLPDTIAYDIQDYPSSANFGNLDKNVYSEDIYVGYRYFNTFAKDRILYPFGYGLSYTGFNVSGFQGERSGDDVRLQFTVRNTGTTAGKEVVQIYYSAPQGQLGRPARELATYHKTGLLEPGGKETVEIRLPLNQMAAYDDSGVTGHPCCFILEEGTYEIYVSTDSLTDLYRYTVVLDDSRVVKQCTRALPPQEAFERIKPVRENGGYTISRETVPVQPGSFSDRALRQYPDDIPFTGDKGIRLMDVKNGTHSMEAFIAQLTDEELACIAIGEGMNSPKVTGGTGCAFGGVTPELLRHGIPIACGSDGPSGIRMDCGAKATLMPCGTALAASWNDELVERLYTYEGLEMAAYDIDVLLGPGVNIHRHPLNGRNFEYFSEDPLLTGRMAAAVCRGIARSGGTATIKHFCANNQETNRHSVNSVISQRALREIYLKAFEPAVRDGSCRAVMTSYNPVNGCWSAGNYDLTTVILREEWGFSGFVMTDWWAKIERDSILWGRTDETPPLNLVPMAEAQNDIYMVHETAADFRFSNLLEALQSGRLKKGILQRNAGNICRFLMNSNAMERFNSGEAPTGDSVSRMDLSKKLWSLQQVSPDTEYSLSCERGGTYFLKVCILSCASELSQNTVIVYVDGEYMASFTVCGAMGNRTEAVREIRLDKGAGKLTFKYPANALCIEDASLYGEAV